MITIISLSIAGLIVIYLIVAFNSLVKLKNMTEEGWSGIDVQLKKRYNLIPNLVSTVKGYATHEKEVFENVAAMRSTGISAQTVKEQAKAENMITQALGKLFAVAENYPDLKASDNFADLQNQLAKIESDIELARRYYNGTVRENNIKVESFPSNIVASMFNFKKFDFFELDDAAARTTPKVDFS
ncbi:MAG: LemA family protein [Cyclobacteriaceae bacterium]|nr:LemA family protein [Cyclobacteriaceae bacterium]